MRIKLTQERLMELLEYNPNTGDWIWLVGTDKPTRAGTKAGSLSNNGRRTYRTISVDNQVYVATRLAFLYMTGEPPISGLVVDHIDRNPQNDAWSNLRIITVAENNRNCMPNKDSTTGVTGVSRSGKKWKATFRLNNKKIHVGVFDSIKCAESAVIAARIKAGFSENHGLYRGAK